MLFKNKASKDFINLTHFFPWGISSPSHNNKVHIYVTGGPDIRYEIYKERI